MLTVNEITKQFLESIEKGKKPRIALQELNEAWPKGKDVLPPIFWAIEYHQPILFDILVLAKVDLNQKYDALSLLQFACCCDEPEIVLKLIRELKMDANSRSEFGFSNIMFAAQNNRPEIVSLLVQLGVDCNFATTKRREAPKPITPKGTTPLMRAAAYGHTAVIRVLANNKADLNAQNEDGKTALMLALENNRFIAAAVLMSLGARISIAEQKLIDMKMKLSKEDMEKLCSPKTPTDAKEEEEAIAIKDLIEAPKSTDPKKSKVIDTKESEKLLAWCLKNNHFEGLKALVQQGINLDEQLIEGLPPIFWVAKNAYNWALELLYKVGANFKIKNKNSKTFSEYAQANFLFSVQKKVNYFEKTSAFPKEASDNKPLLTLLERTLEGMRRNIDKTKKSQNYEFFKKAFSEIPENKMTPLTWAIQHANLDTIEALLESGADVNEMDKNGDTPLTLAAKLRGTVVLELLLKAGANIHQTNLMGDSPLLAAFDENYNLYNVKYLIDSGASVFQRNTLNRTTPLQSLICYEDNNIKLKKSLLTEFFNRGVDFNTRDFQDKPPLSLMSSRSYGDEYVKLLIELGININQTDTNNVIFLEDTKFTSDFEVYLKKMGADTEFNTSKRYVRRIGHILGLSQRVRAPITNASCINGVVIREPGSVVVETEAEVPSFGLLLLNDILRECPLIKDAHMDKICEAFQFLEKGGYVTLDTPFYNKEALGKTLLNRYRKTDGEDIKTAKDIKEEAEDKIVIIPSGWQKHGISVALYKDKLIITNRGEEGDQKYGSKIYQIPKEKLHLIDADYIESLIRAVNFSTGSFFDRIGKLVDVKDPKVLPIAKFPSKGQKHGTCGFVNHKSSIEPLLYLLKMEELNHLPKNQAEEQAKEYARNNYKEFTHKMRENEVTLLIENIKKPKQSQATMNMYLELVETILKEHHDLPENRGLLTYKKVGNFEMERNRRLLEALPKEPDSWLLKIREDAKNDELLAKALTTYDVYVASYNKDGTRKLSPTLSYQKDLKTVNALPISYKRPDFYDSITAWERYLKACGSIGQALTEEQFSALSREIDRLKLDVFGSEKPVKVLNELKSFFEVQSKAAPHITHEAPRKK